MKKTAVIFLLVTISLVHAQEALKSAEEEYYDFLSLQGITVRPALNYRTLSDSVWNIETEQKAAADENGTETAEEQPPSHPWQGNNLGTRRILFTPETAADNAFMRGIDQSITLRIYGPEWYNSLNTASPYGQNDGALWQGKGYNTSLTAGARLEGYGLELTFKPQVSFSQNREFDILPSNTDSEYGYFWGYGKNVGCDAPQRFGDSSFWTFDWGDTEVRYTWHTLTAGFGTQAIWLGPAWLNPMLHSNNAATYPKFDIGIRKQRVILPGLNWNLGEIEGRIWTGYLTESDYFDNRSSNDHNLIHGFTFSYAPSFLDGLTIGLNRTCLVKASKENLKYVLPVNANTHVGEQEAGEDQKFSFTADYLFPSVGFEIYGEIGTDDYAPGGGLKGYQRYLIHTMTYTVGAKKSMTLSEKKKIYGEIIFEWSNTEMSQNYQLSGPYSFGFHYQITQGYTNRGQWLGSGIGYGGNTQHLEYRLYYPKGSTFLFIGRNNPDNNFIYSKAINTTTNDTAQKYGHAFKANYYFGGTSTYFITRNLSISAGAAFDLIINPLYNIRDENKKTVGDDQQNNWNFQLKIKYRF